MGTKANAAIDLSEFAAFCGTKRQRCGIALALEALAPEDAAKLRAALAEPGITGAGISRWLIAKKHRIGPQVVTRHRSGECSCGR